MWLRVLALVLGVAAVAVLAASGPGARLGVWDWRTGEPAFDAVPLPSDPRCLDYRPDGRHLAVTCAGGELLVLDAEFELRPDDPDSIAQRLRQIWISKKARQPLSSQSAGCVFKNPRGQSAGELIEQAGLKGTRLGGAEVNDRHANFIVTHEGATSNDVLRLMDLIRSKVSEQFGVHLETELRIW